MTHLSHAELVDAADGTLPPARSAHVETCAACRAEVDGFAAALADVRRVDVPEPSPLYWLHLSARVSARVAEETIAPAWRAGWRDFLRVRHLVPAASVLALVGAVVISGLLPRDRRIEEPAPVPNPLLASVDAAGASDDSEAWQMLTSAAADTPIEDAHAAGMGVPVGAVDRAVQRMSAEELNALGRLLEDELRRSGD